MKHDIDNPEVRSYLAAVEARLAHLPADQSEEILFGVREHIAEALARGGQSAAEVLASLGSPDDVLTGYSADTPQPVAHQTASQPAARSSFQSSTLWVVATAILLPFGIFAAGVGYLFGLAGLWMGTRWKVWEKIVGTLLFPGGVLGAIFVARVAVWIPTPATDSTAAEVSIPDPMLPGMGAGATVALICIPILVAVYLLVVGLRRGHAAQLTHERTRDH